jgi:hypothetical protein
MFQRHTLDGDIYFHVFQELSPVLFTLMKSTESFPGRVLHAGFGGDDEKSGALLMFAPS